MLLMADALVVAYTVAFEEVEDGWVMATILEKPGAISQGRNRAEARENVRDALREILLHEADVARGDQDSVDVEALELSIAP